MSLFNAGTHPALDENGEPISGAKWRFYLTGTTTPATVYADADLSTPLGAFITADSAGRFAPAYLDDDVVYRAVLEDADGAQISPYDIDPVEEANPISEPDGASLVGFKQAWTTAREYDLLTKGRQNYDLSDFDAPGVGNDWTDALTKMMAAFDGGDASHCVLPEGDINFETQLTATESNKAIRGRGIETSRLIYQGSTLNQDLIVIGDGTGAEGWDLGGFYMNSATALTDGAAIRLKSTFRSHLRDIVLAGQGGDPNLWDGFWFDVCDYGFLTGFQVSTANCGLRVNGGAVNAGAGFYMDQGKICAADSTIISGTRRQAVGLHLAGGFGGLQWGGVDIIGNNTNVLVDNSESSLPNREMTLGSLGSCDVSYVGPGIHLANTVAGTFYLGISGWIASAKTHNIQIDADASAGYRIIMAGGQIYNAQTGSGIHNDNDNVDCMITGSKIWNNALWGINNQGGYRFTLSNINWDSNGSGNFTGSPVLENSDSYAVTVANGGSEPLSKNGKTSGLAIVRLPAAGDSSASYQVGGGSATLVAGSSAIWDTSTTTPTAGKLSVAQSGGVYRIYNNSGSDALVHATILGA